MSKDQSDRNRGSREEKDRTSKSDEPKPDPKAEEQSERRSGSGEMALLQKGLKFVSDEDIVRRRTA